METKVSRFTFLYSGKVALILSLFTTGYWVVVNIIDVYRITIVGAIYEMLWVFMVAFLFVIPVASVTAVIVKRFENSFFYLMSVVLCLGSFIWISFYL